LDADFPFPISFLIFLFFLALVFMLGTVYKFSNSFDIFPFSFPFCTGETLIWEVANFQNFQNFIQCFCWLIAWNFFLQIFIDLQNLFLFFFRF